MEISKHKKYFLFLLVVVMIILAAGCGKQTVPLLEVMDGEDMVNEIHVSHGMKGHDAINDKAVIQRVIETLGEVGVYQLSAREESKFFENGEKLTGKQDFYTFTLIQRDTEDCTVKRVVGIAMVFEDGSVYVADPEIVADEDRPAAYLSKDRHPALMADIGKIIGF